MNKYLEIIKQQQETINLLIKMLNKNDILQEITGNSGIADDIFIIKKSDFKSFEKEKFIEHLRKKGRSENTIDVYTRTVKYYYRKYDLVDEENLQKWEEEIQKFKPKTINLKITAMISYLKFIGYPDREFKRVKEQKRNYCDNIITEEQYHKFVEWTFENKKITTWKALIIMGCTGVRASELINLKSKDLRIGYADIIGKGNKQRRIYFPKKYAKQLIPYCNENYIVTNKNGSQLTTRSLDYLLKRHGEKAGIPKEVCHAHSFRHFFAKEFLKHNNDITLLGDILGHSSVATTSIYTRMSTDEQRRKINRIVKW